MIDDRTPHLGLPLPHPLNELNEDAPRLRSALTGVDVAFADVDSALATKADEATNDTAHASLYAAIKSAAGSIKWSDLQGKPAAFPATAHTHADLAADIATAKGQATWEALPGKPFTFPATAHKTSHKTGAADAIAPADIGAATANHVHPPGTATKLQTARNIALTGAVAGSASFDGGSNVTINTTRGTTDAAPLMPTADTVYIRGSSCQIPQGGTWVCFQIHLYTLSGGGHDGASITIGNSGNNPHKALIVPGGYKPDPWSGLCLMFAWRIA